MEQPLVFVIVSGAVIGGAIGSFLGCVTYRLPRRESIWGRSCCPQCGVQIPGQLNIPVVSWLWLRGRSKCCSEPISPRYLAYETASVGLGVALALVIGWTLLWGLSIALIAAITIASAIRRRGGP